MRANSETHPTPQGVVQKQVTHTVLCVKIDRAVGTENDHVIFNCAGYTDEQIDSHLPSWLQQLFGRKVINWFIKYRGYEKVVR